MLRNFERFSTPESMKELEIREGISEYEEEKKEIEEEKQKRLIEEEKQKRLIEEAESFFDYVYDNDSSDEQVSKLLNNFSQSLKNEILKQWLNKDVRNCFLFLDKFGILSSDYQKIILESLKNSSIRDENSIRMVFSVFEKITDKDLLDFIINKTHINFPVLGENKEKIPEEYEYEILKKVSEINFIYDRGKLVDSKIERYAHFDLLLPYLEKFSLVEKEKLIKDAQNKLRNLVTENSKDITAIIKYCDKLEMSQDQIMEILLDKDCHKGYYKMFNNIEYFSQENQKIILEKFLLENPSYILENLRILSKSNIKFDINNILDVIEKNESLDFIRMNSTSALFDFGEIISAEWIEKIAKNYPEFVAENIDKVKNINKKEFVDFLYEQKCFKILLENYQKLEVDITENLLMEAVENGFGTFVVHFINMDKFHNKLGVFSRDLYLELSKQKELKSSLHEFMLKKFKLNKEDVLDYLKSDSECDCFYILNNVDNFEGLELNQELAEIILKKGEIGALIDCLYEFKNINFNKINKIILKVITSVESSQREKFMEFIVLFKGLDHNRLIRKMMKTNEYDLKSSVLNNIFRFKGINIKNIFNELIDKGLSYDILKDVEKYKDLIDSREVAKKILNKSFDPNSITGDSNFIVGKDIIKFNNFFKPCLDENLNFVADVFGENFVIDKEVVSLVKSISDGNIGENELKKLNINKTGKEGLNQLKLNFFKLKKDILEEDFDIKSLVENDVYRKYFASYVRFDNSEWGNHDDDSFKKTVYNFVNLKENDEIKELSKNYQTSETILVDKINKEDQDNFQYSEQFLNRYGVLKNSFKNSIKLFEENNPLTFLVNKAEEKRKIVIKDLQGKLSKTDNEKAISFLEQRISSLESLNLRSVENFQENFFELSKFNEFHEELRQLVFFKALHKHKNYREKVSRLNEKEKVGFDDISLSINFVEHIVNEETWKKYFTDKKALKSFRDITNTKALIDEFARAQNQKSKNKTALNFMPTRGILMEFSGHIADACWASEYKSIAKSFPNFISLIMIQNKDTKHERLAGASMLIETESKDGTPLLVIRGLNPIENVINNLVVEDFFDKFIDFLREIAQKEKRELAIVIDDHCGGSGTNRPVLYSYLEKKRKELKHIRLNSEDNTEFNDYNIVNDVYLVD